MEVDIENIQFSKHSVKLIGSLVKRIFISLRKKCVYVCFHGLQIGKDLLIFRVRLSAATLH